MLSNLKIKKFKPCAWYDKYLGWTFFQDKDCSTTLVCTDWSDPNISDIEKCIDYMIDHKGNVVGFKIHTPDLMVLLQERADESN